MDGTLLMAGGVLQRHFTMQQSYAPQDPSTGSGELRHDFTAAHLYLIAEHDLPGHLRLHGALTAARNSLFGNRLSPKLALVWTPRTGDVVKAVASTGFRPPTTSEAFYEDGATYLPNPALRPETTTSMELAWEHRLGRHAALTATAFTSRFHDLIQFVTVPAPGLLGPPDPAVPSDWRQQAQNVDHLTSWGAELSAEVSLGQRLRASTGLSWQRSDRAHPINFPAFSAVGTMEVRSPWDPLQFVADATFVSSRDKDPANHGARAHVPAGALFGLGANLEVPGVKGLLLHARVVNLLSTAAPDPLPNDFAPVSELPVAPRTLVLALRWRWN
jgi:outer membrane receptor protein involved in Fe transport